MAQTYELVLKDGVTHDGEGARDIGVVGGPYLRHLRMTGVRTLVPIMLDHVNAGRLSLARFVDRLPYDGETVTGTRGRQVMWDSDLVGPSGGEAVRFLETLWPESAQK